MVLIGVMTQIDSYLVHMIKLPLFGILLIINGTHKMLLLQLNWDIYVVNGIKELINSVKEQVLDNY